MATIGERLRLLREERGMGQKEVASLLGLSTSAVGHYEIGERKPSLEIIVKLAAYFNETVDFLIGYSDLRRQDYEAITGITSDLTSLPAEGRKEAETFIRFLKGKYGV